MSALPRCKAVGRASPERGSRCSKWQSHYNAGESAEQISEDYDLPLSHVYAGIAYYLANRGTVDRDLAEERAMYDQWIKRSVGERAGE